MTQTLKIEVGPVRLVLDVEEGKTSSPLAKSIESHASRGSGEGGSRG